MDKVKSIVDNLHETANSKRADYTKYSFIMTDYIMKFQALNDTRIDELLSVQPNNIDFDKKTLEMDGTIH